MTRRTASHAIPKCSVVIRAYNEADHINRLLEGVSQQTLRDVEIILVDSGSTDATVKIASRFGARIVHVQPQEFTFGRSLNRGIAAAAGDLVVIASAHVYPIYPDWLERLLEPFADAKVALTYGKQRAPQDSRFSEQQIYHQWYPESSGLQQSNPFCNNANAAVRRVLWKKHAYDETLTGLEDLAWAKWAMDKGYAIAYVAEAEVVHVHNETPRAVHNRYRREAMAFKQLYPEAHFNFWDFLRLMTSNISSDLWHALRQGVLLRHFASIFWFRFMQFHGTRLGYRRSEPLTWQLRQTFYYPRGLQASQPAARNVEPIRYNQNKQD